MTLRLVKPAPRGYRKKPLWIYLLSAFMCLSPPVSFVAAVRRAGESLWYSPETWLAYARRIPAPVWGLIAFFVLSGLTVLLVRKLTWMLALGALGALLLYNLVLFRQLPLLAGAAILALTLFPRLREPFLSPKLRWWEQAPRQAVHLKAVAVGSGAEVEVLNLSATGALLASDPFGGTRAEASLCLAPGLVVLCKVVRSEGARTGVQFLYLSASSRRKLRKLIHQAARKPGTELRIAA
jgi:hypothetical protein